jgi:rod shape-determining protein MreD
MNTALPGLSVLLAVFAAGVPWGLPADATFILPLVVVMMVFCWRALPATVFPTHLAMLLGLLTDIMSGGPLGFWALMALIGATAGGYAGPFTDGRDVKRLWIVWTIVVCLLAGLGWLLASLYFFRWIDWWPIAFGAFVSVLLFPVVLHGVLWIRRGRLLPQRTALYRRWT